MKPSFPSLVIALATLSLAAGLREVRAAERPFPPLTARGKQAADKEGRKEKKAKVTGKVVFKGKAEFQPGTVAVVQLADVSLADAPAKVLGKQTIKNLEKFPIPFAISYDPRPIRRGHRYVVQVRITTGRKLEYINDTSVPVIARGAPTRDVKLPVIRIKR